MMNNIKRVILVCIIAIILALVIFYFWNTSESTSIDNTNQTITWNKVSDTSDNDWISDTATLNIPSRKKSETNILYKKELERFWENTKDIKTQIFAYYEKIYTKDTITIKKNEDESLTSPMGYQLEVYDIIVDSGVKSALFITQKWDKVISVFSHPEINASLWYWDHSIDRKTINDTDDLVKSVEELAREQLYNFGVEDLEKRGTLWSCGMDLATESSLWSPSYAYRFWQLEKKGELADERNSTTQKLAFTTQSLNNCAKVVTIPVAIHIQTMSDQSDANKECYRNMGVEAIEYLNTDFRGDNSEISDRLANKGTYFPDVTHGETCVQFCLATSDHPPWYWLEEGDVAVTFDQTNGDQHGDWREYINITVRNLSPGLGWYSPKPWSPNGRGVVVMKWGRSCLQAPSIQSNGLSRTLTHEMGHHLNLHHTRGPTSTTPNGQCTDDDIADTPLQDGTSWAWWQRWIEHCNDYLMRMNHLNYGRDRYMFTNGQKSAMESRADQGFWWIAWWAETKCNIKIESSCTDNIDEDEDGSTGNPECGDELCAPPNIAIKSAAICSTGVVQPVSFSLNISDWTTDDFESVQYQRTTIPDVWSSNSSSFTINPPITEDIEVSVSVRYCFDGNCSSFCEKTASAIVENFDPDAISEGEDPSDNIPEQCNDNKDNDCDGLIDCEESACTSYCWICSARRDGSNGNPWPHNDACGTLEGPWPWNPDPGVDCSDCSDPSCDIFPRCGDVECDCCDNMDNDGDGLSDYNDVDCCAERSTDCSWVCYADQTKSCANDTECAGVDFCVCDSLV